MGIGFCVYHDNFDGTLCQCCSHHVHSIHNIEYILHHLCCYRDPCYHTLFSTQIMKKMKIHIQQFNVNLCVWIKRIKNNFQLFIHWWWFMWLSTLSASFVFFCPFLQLTFGPWQILQHQKPSINISSSCTLHFSIIICAH